MFPILPWPPKVALLPRRRVDHQRRPSGDVRSSSAAIFSVCVFSVSSIRSSQTGHVTAQIVDPLIDGVD
jgi:hypothetical protein